MSEVHAKAYTDLRLRVSEVIEHVDDAALSAPAPATPAFTLSARG